MDTKEVNNILRSFDFPEVTNDFPTEIETEGYYYDEDKGTNWVTIHKLWTRGVFMAIFRAEPDEQGLSNDDRAEVFGGIMLGASDFTADGIQSILNDYDVRHIDVIDYNLEPDDFQVQMDVVAQNYVQMYDHLKSERAQQ